MSKTLHSVGLQKKQAKEQKGKAPLVSTEASSKEAQIQSNEKKIKPSKKRSLDDDNNNKEDTNIIIQPNQKKVKLTPSLKPVTKSSSSQTKSSPHGKGKGKDNSLLSSVIYLGHIPKGFEEDEIRKFFNQFGKIKKMKLFRSKKSNVSKGFAFLEFENEDIATIVSEAIHGYYLMERQLVCHQIPKEAVHEGMFLQFKQSREHKRTLRQLARQQQQQIANNNDNNNSLIENSEEGAINDDNFEAIYQKHQQYIQKKQDKLNEAGIEFTIPVVNKTEVEKETNDDHLKDQNNNNKKKRSNSTVSESSVDTLTKQQKEENDEKVATHTNAMKKDNKKKNKK